MVAIVSFLSPWMLAGMAMASLPIAAHFLSRRTRRRLWFPSIKLLRESVASTSKLYRLRRWVVLVLRCLAVALIAGAFARPVWLARSTADITAGDSVALVLLVDTSASTARQAEGVSLMNSLRVLADRTVDSVEQGLDSMGIVYASAQPYAAFPELTRNGELIRQELRKLKPTWERANFPAAINLAGELLSKHAGPRRLVILSDMQRTNWADVMSPQGASAALPVGTTVTVVPVGGPEGENFSLSEPRALPVRPLADRPVKLIVRVGNHSPGKQTISVRADVDSRRLGRRTIELDPWTGGDVTFEAELAPPGIHRVIFSIGPDALAADNHAYMVVNAVRRATVVVIADDNPNQPGSGAYFLMRALAPRGDDADELAVRHLSSADIDHSALAGAEAVFVGYVGPLKPKAIEALYQYTNQGGGVALFCGDGPVTENMVALRSVDSTAELLPWIPVQLRDLAAEGSFLRLGEGNWQAPALVDFDEPSREALRQIRFHRVWSVTGATPQRGRLLTFSDGTAAMASVPVGAGRITLCNFSPALAASDLCKYGGFVALMRGLFNSLRPLHQFGPILRVGEPFSGSYSVEAGAAAKTWQVTGPDARTVEAEVSGRTDRPLVNVRYPTMAGFYQIGSRQSAAASKADVIDVIDVKAVNTDARESELRRIEPDVLREALGTVGGVLTYAQSDQPGAILNLHGKSLWYVFVLAAMGVIFLEQALLSVWRQ